MDKYVILGLLGVILIGISIHLCYCSRPAEKKLSEVHSAYDVVSLFAQTPDTIKKRVALSLEKAQKELDILISIPDAQRTFANTAQALDRVDSLSDAAILMPLLSALELVSPDAAIRDAAHEGSLKVREFFIDQIGNNEQLYRAFKAYAKPAIANAKDLTPAQRYFLTETLADFERNGLALPADQLAHVRVLNKELTALSLDFEKNIAQDNKTITVSREELAGLDDDFIDSLKKTADAKTGATVYELVVNGPTYMLVMQHGADATTRKKMFLAWQNRAYPANEVILKQVITKRDELAKLLGFESFAAYTESNLMAKNPARVKAFLQDLIAKSSPKEVQEFAQLFTDLPASVQKTAQGKLWGWDVRYAQTQYKEKHFDLDDRLVAEYFPTEQTIEKLLGIYQNFLSLEFKQESVPGLWHNEVKLVSVYSHAAEKDQLLGYLLLDLYPRPNKYTHAAYETLVPATFDAQGVPTPWVALVMANFPKSTPKKPALLLHSEVETFFHEFGHAMHGLLGRTALASQSGTSVKHDFVEVPSQMFEEWLWDADILKALSGHYKTGAPLSEELIAKIISLKKFDSGFFIQRQAQLSLLDFAMYQAGAEKEPYQILSEQSRARTHVAFDPEEHMYASFGHLMSYGAKYYSYMWSKVFSLDLFATVKKEGLQSPAVGQRLTSTVLSKGGSQDPEELLRDFLGREPNMQAFLDNLGL